MKVTVLITVEKDGWGWDEKSVKREMSVTSPNPDVLASATTGAIKGIKNLILDAIVERQNLIEAEENTDDND